MGRVGNGKVKLKLHSPQQRLAYGETLLLDYEVVNNSKSPIFLVQERPTIEVRDGRIEVSLAEQPMPEGAAYYGYRPPRLDPIQSGGKKSERVTVAMPPRRGQLGEDGWEAAELPVQGALEVILTLGYTLEPVIDSPLLKRNGGPIAAFLEHQHTVSSPPLRLVFVGPHGDAAR